MALPMTSSPLFRRLSISNKSRPFKIAILGQNGVGKSALTVRFLTQRFIGDYDPLLENTYSCSKCIDGDTTALEILDTAAQEENSRLETNIKWADAFILVYSVTDRCSFNECSRLKVVINSYTKRPKNNGGNGSPCLPVVLVGNQIDRTRDRMVSTAEGRAKSIEMNCIGFYETSVREERDSAFQIISDMYRHCRKPSRRAQLQQRLSYPMTASLDRRDRMDRRETECTTLTLQRRNKALHTIS